MRVLASMPSDLGKVLECGGGDTITVQEGPCERCGRPSDMVLEKDKTPEGVVPMYTCTHCASILSELKDRYLSAFDVPDRLPHAGYMFVVCEKVVNDPEQTHLYASKSYRSAVGFHRRIQEQTKPLGGLFPDKGVVELSLDACDKLGFDTTAERNRLICINRFNLFEKNDKIELMHQMYIACFNQHHEEDKYHNFLLFCAEVFSQDDPHDYLVEMSVDPSYGKYAKDLLHGVIDV